jgi:hypothetical protein
MQTIEERFNSKVNTNGPIPTNHPELGPCHIWTAGTFNTAYPKFKCEGKAVRAHRLAYTWVNGVIPDGLSIDHICSNPLCVNPKHMRLATTQQNNINQKRSIRNKSGRKGVSWFKRDGKWKAVITHDGQQSFLGYFDDKEDAYAAYCEKAKEMFGEFANLGN